MHHREENVIITYKNKLSYLENEVNLNDDNSKMDDSASGPSDLANGGSNMKQRLNHFYIEFHQKWT